MWTSITSLHYKTSKNIITMNVKQARLIHNGTKQRLHKNSLVCLFKIFSLVNHAHNYVF